MKRILSVCCALILSLTTAWADGSLYTQRSALAEGRWVKVRVNDDGIYKLSYSDLRKMGFSDPEKVSVHGYGGWILNEDFSKPYIDDVPAVAVYRGSDYILFYGRGPVKWSYDDSAKEFVHENNPYSMYGYYFVTDATETHDMGTTASVSGDFKKITSYDDHLLHEKDQEFLQKSGQTGSGRELFGENFSSTLSQTFNFSVPGITNENGKASIRFVSYTGTGAGVVTLSIDGTQIISGKLGQDNDTYTKATPFAGTSSWTGDKSENPKVTVNYSVASQPNCFLDYIRLQMKRTLQPNGGAYTFFRSLDAMGTGAQFIIQNATQDMAVFDITDGIACTRMETTLSGSEMTFSIAADSKLHEFVLVDLAKNFSSPETVGTLLAQNLHALPQTDMVILAPPAFVSEAERLAQKHRTKRDSISVVVVTPEQVYNEFSSGTPDATAIRRFMKMFYDRKTSEADAPKYLLLFGDGSHDNRQLTTSWKSIDMTNFLLTFQSQYSLGGNKNSEYLETFVTDDYFGFLADNEGSRIAGSQLLLGIGRFPVRTLSQARSAVDKVIDYIDNGTAGSWKNQLCFIADDGNSNDGYSTIHMSQSYQLTQYLEENYPEFVTNKLFFDAFKKSNSGGSSTYPDVITNIQKQEREGRLIINYTGHGNSSSLSDEHVITQSMIQGSSYPNLPLWITAACDFTPFDNTITSAGEDVFLSEKSGGIALFTTSRVAYDDPNFRLNLLMIQNLFKKENNRRLTLGEVLKETKNNYNSYYKLCFVLIGDPALTLSYPEYRLNVTEINGQTTTDTPIAFKALDKVTIKGEVHDLKGNKTTAFNGMLTATIYDSQDTITTLDNNNRGRTFSYVDYPNTIFKGHSSVENGDFSFTFTVPKDISYSGLSGKINLYALNETTLDEAQGSFKNFTVGGTADVTDEDTTGPEIRQLYLNDSTWTDGGTVNETPFFVARVWDKTGINIGGSSIGHDIMLTIDNTPSLSYNLNSYFETVINTDGEGLIKYSIPALPAGTHTAELKVWDVLNNSSTYTFTFVVEEGLKPFFSELTAGPVPARENVTFYLYHNRPESQMKIDLRVYDLTGRMQWRHEESGSSDLFKAYSITWDLKNGNGGRLRPGIYIYRAGIRTSNSSEATKAKKLIILAQ